MNKIKNILICGLGGVGTVCAANLFENPNINLKILIDKSRLEKYRNTITTFNNKNYNFEYVLPEENNFKADLIVIATKNDGLNTAIKNIKNFVNKETIIISLLNGIHSEQEIAKIYGWNNLLYSFYLGNSCIRQDRKITMKGKYNIVIGTDKEENKGALQKVEKLFKNSNISYKTEENILDEYWKKFLINVGVNQACAYTGVELKEIRENEKQTNLLKNLMDEARQIAEKEGLKNHKEIYNKAETFLLKEMDNAHPSMLQDIENKRKSEVEIFAGKIIELGKKHNIKTPNNELILKTIKKAESNYLQ